MRNDEKFNEKILAKIKQRISAEIIKPEFLTPLTDDQLIQKIEHIEPIPKDVLIVVNDLYRSTPTKRVMKILRESEKIRGSVQFLVATGSHRPPKVEEIKMQIGMKATDELSIHDSNIKESLKRVGTTSQDTPVNVSKKILEAENVLTINSVEPHFFAGYTGGVKSIIPGLSNRETIRYNHNLSILNTSVFNLEENRVHKDLAEASNMVCDLSQVESVQIVNHDDAIMFLEFNQLNKAFQSARKVASQVYRGSLQSKVKNVISIVSPPLNTNFYQAHKAAANVEPVLQEGGNLIIVSECPEGIGNDAFIRELEKIENSEEKNKDWVKRWKKIAKERRGELNFGFHKAYLWKQLIEKFNVYYFGTLDEQYAKRLGMKKQSLEELNKQLKAIEKSGESALIDEMGGYTAPQVL